MRSIAAVGIGVEIDGAGNAAGRGAAHPALAVHQHQHALGAQIAQVDLAGAGADAAAVGRKAEVAARVVACG